MSEPSARLNPLRVASRNLARNRRRNFATGVAIALGFAAMVALGGYINRVENYLRVYTLYATRVGHVSIYKKSGLERFAVRPKDFSLTPDDQAKIAAALQTMDGIDLSGPQLTGAGLIGNGCKTLPFLGIGIDPILDKNLREHPEMQKWLGPRVKQYSHGVGIAVSTGVDDAVILADGLARLLGKTNVVSDFKGTPPLVIVNCLDPNFKQQIAADANVQLVSGSWSGMLSALDGEVVAHYNTGITETNNSAVLTTIRLLQKLYDTENVTLWSVWLKDAAQTTEFKTALAEKLKAAGVEADLYPWTDDRMSPFYTGTVQFLQTMVGFLTFVLATVVVFSVFNAATMTVIERSQEIGMMRSLGYTRRRVRVLFVLEMLVLTAMSVGIGAVLATVGILLVNWIGIELHPPGVAGGLPLKLQPSVFTVLLALVTIVTLSIATTWFAVRSVAKRNIASLLLGTQR